MHRGKEGPGQRESGVSRPREGGRELHEPKTLSLQFQALDRPEETLVGQFPPCALSLLFGTLRASHSTFDS